MHATWDDRVRLKRAAGISLRGRDNTKPVLHMTLSWHASDEPSPEHMKETSLAALKAIELEDHQALVVAHSDKDHLHVHLVINTVHPETGRTAPLKYSKERLSRWAEAYEKEHGLHCVQRIENNQKRDQAKSERASQALHQLTAASDSKEPPTTAPYVPIKDHSPSRQEWFERKEIVARMKTMRARFEQPHGLERSALAQKHAGERKHLWYETQAALDRVRDHLKQEYRPKWRETYKRQAAEMAYVRGTRRKTTIRPGSIQTHETHKGIGLFGRARFVIDNRKRLGAWKRLKLKEMPQYILSRDKLLARLSERHAFERKTLARAQSARRAELSENIRKTDKQKFAKLAAQQQTERQAQWDRHNQIKDAQISFQNAKQELLAEREPAQEPTPPRPLTRRPREQIGDRFAQAAEKPSPQAKDRFQEAAGKDALSRSQQIARDMEVWRRRNGDRDQGREL